MPRSTNIQLNITLDGEQVPMFFPLMEKELNRIGKSVVKSAQVGLKKQGKVVTGNLSRSLFYSIEGSNKGLEVTFEGSVPYWDFVEQGVQGAISKAKAPDSPFQFGSGRKQETSGTLRGGIDKWVIQKPFGPIRGKSGRFIPRKSLVYLVSRKIYNYGIAPSKYYATALDAGWKKAKRRFANAIGLDVANFMYDNIESSYTIEIHI